VTEELHGRDDAGSSSAAHDPAALMAAEAFTGFMTDTFAAAVCRAVAEQAAKGVTGTA